MTLDDYVAIPQERLWLPDPYPLLATAGTVAANRIDGEPVWLVVVGPSSSGKTMLLEPFLALDGVEGPSDLTLAGLSALEDDGLMRRIALLRRYYFDNAPELARYLVTIEPWEHARAQGFPFRRQALRTVAGMVGVITAVLAGSTASLIAIVSSDHSGAAALISGVTVAADVLTALLRAQWSALRRDSATPLEANEDEGPV